MDTAHAIQVTENYSHSLVYYTPWAQKGQMKSFLVHE